MQPELIENSTQNSESSPTKRMSYMLSWVFLALALFVFLFGCYAVYQVVMLRPQANILLTNKYLSVQQQVQLQDKLKHAVQGNFFTADLHYVKEEVTNIDWVKSVQVSRKWPNGIAINVFPRHAVARFGSERLVSDSGYVFSGDSLNANKYEALPLLFGPADKSSDIMRQYFQINQWFSGTGLHLVELSMSEQMTWFLKFDNGLRVIVDKEESEKKLFRLSRLLNKQLRSVQSQMEAVDLRYRNGIAVSWKSGQPEELGFVLKQKA